MSSFRVLVKRDNMFFDVSARLSFEDRLNGSKFPGFRAGILFSAEVNHKVLKGWASDVSRIVPTTVGATKGIFMKLSRKLINIVESRKDLFLISTSVIKVYYNLFRVLTNHMSAPGEVRGHG